jgi:hypothetical protein
MYCILIILPSPWQLVWKLQQGCIFFYNPPPPPWGGGKESKGLRAREENQRRVEKWKGRGKRREKFRG